MSVRILWLKTELLHPVDKGGKIRSYNMLKALKRDCQITYLTLDDGTADDTARELASEYCHELVCVPHRRREKFTTGFYVELVLNLASNLPYAIKKYESVEMRREIEKRVGSFDVLICDFLAPAVNVPRDLDCATVLFQHNVEAMIWKRHYEVQTNAARKAYLFRQWRKMFDFEAKTCPQFDCVVAVSREDREMMKEQYGVENVYDVPTGVDTDFFRPGGELPRKPHNLVFTGSMDWLPNEDAIRYFTEQIMPRIKQEVSDVTLTVVGRDPYPGLVELSKRDSSVIVTGRVEDVRPYMEEAAVYIVPLRIGGGTRLKIYEGMAMEKAIVSTSIGAEGLPVTNGEEILLADTPESFADSVVRLLKDPSLADEIGQRAAARVTKDFGWESVADSFGAICERAMGHEKAQKAQEGKEGTEGKEGPAQPGATEQAGATEQESQVALHTDQVL
ncbi:MAG TPA: glycosyltransferase [Pyrinomonadaceae bacterium]|nr:glycosyltransferase [Pyrinomonadaceae bacterium]